MNDTERLADRVALVTGATAGIGRAVAEALARARMKVALVARDAARLERLAAELEQAGGAALAVPVDLRDARQISAAFDRVREEWGGVDVLVNSAGLGRVAPLASGDPAAFRELLEVNVLALTIATREAVADMQRRGVAGHVVHISSLSAYRVQTQHALYAATKHAVRALTEGLRQELRAAGSPIRVTAVSPGDTATEFMARMLGSAEAAAAAAPPYATLQPADVAGAVLYALGTPPHVEVHDILIRPTGQPD